LNRAYSMVTNIGASVWVMDPAVTTPSSPIPLPNNLLDAVKSMDGVQYAVPIFVGSGQVRLSDGIYQGVSVIGLDDETLFGHPRLELGEIKDIFADHGFIVVRDSEFSKLENPQLGTIFELNDNRSVIVGIAAVAENGLNGVPTLYTTFNRATSYVPTPRFNISYILVEPKSQNSVLSIQTAVAKLGYVAKTKQQFNDDVTSFYVFKTGIGTNILMMTAISFIVGLTISGSTFYTFILENLDKFGALKAIGAKNQQLMYMIFFMATFTSLTGYGLGIGLVTIMISIAHAYLPNYAAIITFSNLLGAFILVLLMATLSSYIGIRRVLRIEPFDIFRS